MSRAHVVVVLGSVTAPGRMHRALFGMEERARTADIETTLIDLASIQMTFADGTPMENLGTDVQSAVSAVASADGVILASPVYRGTLTGALKNFLDLLPFESLYQKPVGIVAMGATPHHFLGTASHLRDICAWFGALVTPTDVYLTGAQFTDGEPHSSANADLDALLMAIAAFAERMKKEPMGPIPLAGRAR